MNLSETQSNTTTSSTMMESPLPSNNIEFFDNRIAEKTKKNEAEMNVFSTTNITPPVTPASKEPKNQENDETAKPKSYRDAIGKKEKSDTTSNENQFASTTGAKSNKQQKKASKSSASNNRAVHGHPQDINDYYDDSWYYGNEEGGYLSTGYTDDQEIFIGNLSAQVTENEVTYC